MKHSRAPADIAATAEPPAPATPPDLARRAALGDFAPDVIAWLTAGLRRHVIDGDALDVALGLDRASRIRVRDDALRRAAGLLALSSAGPWIVAERLALAVARHHRLRGTPTTPVEAAVAAAFAAGERVPETQRQLYSIIR